MNKKYTGVQLKTKFDVIEKTTVFSTRKSLNERFSMKQPRSVFILNNGYTALYKDNRITGRVAFENQRNLNIHKRFSLYKQGDLKAIEKNSFSEEDKNHLKIKLTEVGNIRRTVLAPSTYSQEEPEILTDGNENSSSTSSITANVPRRSCKRLNSKKISEIDGNNNKRNSLSYERTSRKRTCDGRDKRNPFSASGDTVNDSEGSEPIIYTKYRKKNFYQSLYKWRRGPPSKEKLDEELDHYMSETKLKTPAVSAKEDLDAFVEEYLIETEKTLNESGSATIDVE